MNNITVCFVVVVIISATVGCKNDKDFGQPPEPYVIQQSPAIQQSPPPMPPQVTPTVQFNLPSEDEIGTIDCHHNKQVAPVFPTQSMFENWVKDDLTAEGAMFRYNAKFVPNGEFAKVLKDKGQEWMMVKITSGTFSGYEGYTFRTCINK